MTDPGNNPPDGVAAESAEKYQEFDEMSDIEMGSMAKKESLMPPRGSSGFPKRASSSHRHTVLEDLTARLAQVPESMMGEMMSILDNSLATSRDFEAVLSDVDGMQWTEQGHPSEPEDEEMYYTTRQGACSWFFGFFRSILYSDDFFVSVWCATSRTSQKTQTIQGVAEHCKWERDDGNRLHFFVPHYGPESTELPLEIFIQLWDWDSHSEAELKCAKVVDLRPALCQGQRGLAIKLKDGRDIVGTLFMNINIVEQEDMRTEQLEELQAIRVSKQERRRNGLEEKRAKEDLDPNSEVYQLLKQQLKVIDKYEDEIPYVLLEVEVLRYEAFSRPQNNLQKRKTFFTALGVFIVWLFGYVSMFTAFEGWSWLETLYWALVTMSTVGYGDMSPETAHGRAIACLWIICNNLAMFVIIIGWMQSVVTQARLEKLQNDANERWIHMVEYNMDRREEAAEKTLMGDSKANHLLHMLENQGLDIPEPMPSQDSAAYLIGFWCVVIVLWMTVWCIYFCTISGHPLDFGTALYFGIITSTTVGYGDVLTRGPGREDDEIFICCTILFGVIMWANLGSEISSAWESYSEKDDKVQSLLEADLTQEDLRKFAACSGGPGVDRADFLQGMLLDLGLVDPAIVDQINAKFKDFEKVDGEIVIENQVELVV